jgi:hypothetical protein
VADRTHHRLILADASARCLEADGSVKASASGLTDHLAAGTRVRIDAAVISPRRVTRWVVARHGDTLLVTSSRRAADTVAVALSDITRLDVSRTRGFQTKPVVIGALLGGVAGGVHGYNQRQPRRTCVIFCNATPETEVYFGAFDGAVAGTAVALLANRLRPESGWTRVTHRPSPTPRGRLGLMVAPTRVGMTLAVSVSHW